MYSSRNIDFNKMKWDPTNSQEILHSRRIYSPIIEDVVFDENDLLLITNEGITYIFNLVRMTVSKTQIKKEQAKLFPYHNRLHLFSDFLVYDNIVMVSHYNMISICDLNAKICKEKKSWRHLAQPVNALVAENREILNNFDSLRDPFRVCDQNIRMIKLIQ